MSLYKLGPVTMASVVNQTNSIKILSPGATDNNGMQVTG